MNQLGGDRRRLQAGEIDSLVAIELSRMGDAVNTVRPLMALEQALQPRVMHIAVSKGFASFFQILFQGAVVHGVESPDRLRNILAAARVIRPANPRLALSWSPALRNGLLARLSGATVRAGYLGLRGSHTPFLDHFSATIQGARGVSLPFHGEGIQERSRKVLDLIGVDIRGYDSERIPVVWPRRREYQGGRMAVVHPCARWKFREWPDEHVVDLIRRLSSDLQCSIILLGAEADRARLSAIRNAGGAAMDVRVETPATLEVLANTIAGCTIFVGTDSGPLHLAALLGIPAVGLFGPAPPVLTAPRMGRGVALYHGLECSPCRQITCVRQSDPCMNSIRVDEVMNAVHAILPEKPMPSTAS